MAISPKFLNVEGVNKSFISANESKTVLDGISFELPFHDSLAIVGPSGCGKTTLLLIIAGLVEPTGGSIYFQDTLVTAPNRKTALVLQEYGLFPWKKVAANILLGAKLQNIEVSEQRLETLKNELEIEGLDHLYPTQLSGGQRQRVALARALLLNPLLLLLDEPFAAIDTVTREKLQNQLLKAFQKREFSFIIVTHNIEEAVFLGKKIIILGTGRPSIQSVIDNPGTGRVGYRNQPAFFELTAKIRDILEEVA
ncbi:MAG: ATP-binding cassette domain-containing protein [Deltaproteobacteria bacterium]|nr:ATP-binding cassette domain-containing protein [Deltaproteobacteria bacterium]